MVLGLYPVLGEVRVIEHYINTARTEIATRAEVTITHPKGVLRYSTGSLSILTAGSPSRRIITIPAGLAADSIVIRGNKELPDVDRHRRTGIAAELSFVLACMCQTEVSGFRHCPSESLNTSEKALAAKVDSNKVSFIPLDDFGTSRTLSGSPRGHWRRRVARQLGDYLLSAQAGQRWLSAANCESDAA